MEKWIKDPVKCCQLAGVQPPTSAYQQNQHDMLVELSPPTRLNVLNSSNQEEHRRDEQNGSVEIVVS